METKLKVVLGAIGSVVTLCIGCSCVGIFNSAGSDRPATPKQVTPTQSFLPLVDSNTASAAPTDSPSPSDTPIIIPTTKAAPPPPPQKTEDEDKPPKNVYYANCAAVRSAGAAPLYRGEPGYRSGLDGDGDGVACEKK